MNQVALGTTRLRLAFLGAIFASLIATLVLRLYFLQVLSTEEFTAGAERNQIRVVPEEPARGQILDRNGKVLVSNGMSLVVTISKQELSGEQLEQVKQRVADALRIPVAEIDKKLEDKTLSAFTPIPVAENVPEDTVVYIREHQHLFPGVETKAQPTRVYPNGKLASHTLGYLGEILPEQVDDERYKDMKYRPGAIIGRGGIEYAYEEQLHGKEGLRKLEVDSSGDVRRVLGRVEPQKGKDLVTTIDVDIQRITEESLAQGLEKARTIYHKESGKKYVAPAGGAVVMDPRNGEILAMASFPDYDPGAFVGGISQAEYDVLTNDPALPLLNRAIQVSFPPGSTFKPVTAAAALETGVAAPNQRYACPGSLRIADRTFRNWKTSDSGMLTFNQSMADSCDTVFYRWGEEFYRTFRSNRTEVLQDYARRFGFGSKTGIEIPFEKAGRVPDEGWLKAVNKQRPDAFPYATWLPGYTINMSIGQGDVLATPLQLANAYAAIANGGKLHRPHLAKGLIDGTGEQPIPKDGSDSRTVPINPATLQALRSSLEAVTTVGTAASTFVNSPLNAIGVAGKTGTAEFAGKQPHAWFAAYAPARDPQYVVAVMLEEGGHGGETAAPIARRIFEGIFDLNLSEIQVQAAVD
ncbi:MAG TPA: penicillin-binding protein 2 [Actinomycetota bacterium]|nr:penicillin-binding protein 2 [Actinomycetota bacterium]